LNQLLEGRSFRVMNLRKQLRVGIADSRNRSAEPKSLDFKALRITL
jgi:hypothetical protein